MIKPITIAEYNALVEAGRVIDQPILDGHSNYVRTTYSEEDHIDIFALYNAIIIYHNGTGEVTTVYERPF